MSIITSKRHNYKDGAIGAHPACIRDPAFIRDPVCIRSFMPMSDETVSGNSDW